MSVNVYFERASSIEEAIKKVRNEDSILKIERIGNPSNIYCFKVTHTELEPNLVLLVCVTHLFQDVYRIEVDCFPK